MQRIIGTMRFNCWQFLSREHAVGYCKDADSAALSIEALRRDGWHVEREEPARGIHVIKAQRAVQGVHHAG